MSTKLSVSSVILAAVLSGCSQQQVMGGSQGANGSSQSSGGSRISGSQQSGSQQVVDEPASPLATDTISQPSVVAAPVRVYKKQVTPPRRIYTQAPKRRSHSLGLPTAQPGQCFAKVQEPAKYTNKSRRVLIQKAISKRVLVRAPQYRWVNKRVQTRKAYYKIRTIPAQYKTNTRRVMVKPAYNTWQKGHGKITRIDNITGQVMCRVQVPAVYKNVSRRVLVRPAQNIRTLVPATYKTIKQKKFVAPSLYKTIHTPARYKTQNYRVKTSNARYIWRGVVCQNHASKQNRKTRTAAPKKQQDRQVSGINYRSYLAVMNAGSSKTRLNPAKKVYKKAVLKKAKKKKVKSPAPKKMSPEMMPPKKESPKTLSPKMASPEMAPPEIAPPKIAPPEIAPPETITEPTQENSQVTETTETTKTTEVTTTTEETKATETEVTEVAKKSTKQSIVSGIQKALKAKGFDPGAMDGKMGPGTSAALKAFQSSRGLPVGHLNKDTFRALGLIR